MMDEWDVMTETDHLDADWSLIPGSDLNLDQTDSSVLANRVLLPTGKSKPAPKELAAPTNFQIAVQRSSTETYEFFTISS